MFYSKELSSQECVREKLDALHKYPSYRQTIVSPIEITSYEGGIFKCDFTKEVSVTRFIRDYASYLIVKKENGTYLIVGESDKITDKNLNYHLNLGKQIDTNGLISTKNLIQYCVLIALFLSAIITGLYFRKRKSDTNGSPYDYSEVKKSQESTVNFKDERTELFTIPKDKEELNDNYEEAELFTVKKTESIPSTGNDKGAFSAVAKTITGVSENIDLHESIKKTNEYIGNAYSHTRTTITRFFDWIDSLDRLLYGKRMRYFLVCSIVVLIVAPFVDWLWEHFYGNNGDILTFCATLLFFILNLILAFSFISSWRDDTGNWSLERAKSKVSAYWEDAKISIETTKANPLEERLYQLGVFLFLGGIGGLALHHLSVFIRKPLEHFHSDPELLIKFEKITYPYSWIPVLVGVCLGYYLYRNNPIILHRIKNELRQLFGFELNQEALYTLEIEPVIKDAVTDFVINAKTENHFTSILQTGHSNLYMDFAIAVKNWNPRNYNTEYEYQDRLANHLRKQMPDATIKTEYPIGDKSLGNRGRADIVINDSILIEMKRDSSSGAIQRAKGQIAQYSEIWKDRGLVVLLLCDYDYDHARLVFSSTMNDLAKLEKRVLTIVAKPKKQ